MRIILLAFILMTFLQSFSQKIEVLNFKQLEEKWSNNSDTLYIINYWATWCNPCIEELPDFIKLEEESKDKKIKIIMVSLDFASQANSKVNAFVKKKNISSEVVVLSGNPNVWINKVDKNWSGDIPATHFIKKSEKKFFSEQLNFERLQQIILSFE